MRFWLERGVDGFRFDTINFYFHDTPAARQPGAAPETPHTPPPQRRNPYNFQDHLYDKNQPENLPYLKRIRALLDEYPAIAAVGEVGDSQRGLEIVGRVHPRQRQACTWRYGFEFLPPDPPTPPERVERGREGSSRRRCPTAGPAGRSRNHDVMRHVSRWGCARLPSRADCSKLDGRC